MSPAMDFYLPREVTQIGVNSFRRSNGDTHPPTENGSPPEYITPALIADYADIITFARPGKADDTLATGID